MAHSDRPRGEEEEGVEGLKEKRLSRMRSDAMSDAPMKWQQQKSAETRGRILEATVECLVEKGYAHLSTNEVTLRAGVSRGAMHHHFPNRMALVAAVIDHACSIRMERFLDAYFAAIGQRDGVNVVEVATETYWESVQTREYGAYLELAVAALTDAELNSHFLPAAQRIDAIWTQEMIAAFPQWEAQWDALQLAHDFVMSAMMGLLLHRPVLGEGDRLQAVRALIGRVVASLHRGTA
jgi:AcrR family transcriptional regulator